MLEIEYPMKTDYLDKRALFKRLIILSAFIFSTAVPTIAQNIKDCIVIHMKKGGKVLIPTKEHPKILFDNDKLCIGTELYLISGISKYTFGNYTQGIDEHSERDKSVILSENGHIYVKTDNPSSVKVYSDDGKELNINIHINDEGIADINLTDNPIGIYLLLIDGETFKILRK